MPFENLDSLIEQTRPVKGAFKITVGKDQFEVDFYFELPADYVEWVKFRNAKAEWVRDHTRMKVCPYDELNDVWVKNEEALDAVYVLHNLSREPSKLDLRNALKLLQAPSLVEGLLNQIELRRAQAFASSIEEIELKKK